MADVQRNDHMREGVCPCMFCAHNVMLPCPCQPCEFLRATYSEQELTDAGHTFAHGPNWPGPPSDSALRGDA